MRWEDLTIAEFEQAVERAARTCVLPVGVIEAHGPHLPLSADALASHSLACAAADLEPTLIFPLYPWGVNVETKAWPGGIVLPRRLIFDLLENVCAEISRNGCKKIILFSGHGGNRFFLPLYVQMQLDQGIDYTPYYIEPGALHDPEVHRRLFETERHGHACECETSLMLYLAPHATHADWIPDRPGEALDRADHLVGRAYTPADWYARYRDHYAGDARPASAEKGRIWFEHRAERLAQIVKTIKEDEAAPSIYREYDDRIYRR